MDACSEHPLVTVHAETGERVLFVSPSYVKSIVPLTRCYTPFPLSHRGPSRGARARRALALGAEAAAFGTRFLATQEANVHPLYRDRSLAAEPQLKSCFCVDAETARATRRRFLETFADSPIMVIPAHFPTPTAGWIRSHDGSFRFHFDRLR